MRAVHLKRRGWLGGRSRAARCYAYWGRLRCRHRECVRACSVRQGRPAAWRWRQDRLVAANGTLRAGARLQSPAGSYLPGGDVGRQSSLTASTDMRPARSVRATLVKPVQRRFVSAWHTLDCARLALGPSHASMAHDEQAVFFCLDHTLSSASAISLPASQRQWIQCPRSCTDSFYYTFKHGCACNCGRREATRHAVYTSSLRCVTRRS